MSITAYKITESARRTARASGFDIENPDVRYSVQNPMIQQVLAERRRDHTPRSRLLLKGREAIDRFRGKERS